MNGCIVQIYEIQTPGEAEAVVALGRRPGRQRGALGRGLEAARAAGTTIARVRACGARSSLIPLYRDEDAIARTLDYYRPDIVHFCDTLPADGACGQLIEFQFRVKERFPEIAVMRSIPIGPTGHADRVPSLEWARRFEPATDVFLTDTLLVGAGDGGRGRAAGRGVCRHHRPDLRLGRSPGALVQQSRIPVILAGGISPQNAAEAVARVRPAGVDSCTLTNALDADGRPIRFRKDLQKVKALVEAVRRAEIMS